MKVLGLIPARGGSKGIERKNLAPLAGEPLLAHTCRAAAAAKSLTRWIVSTEDREIAQVAGGLGAPVRFQRPVELARDDTPALPVIEHAMEALEQLDGFRADLVVLLQPTSPLRQAEHIDEAVAMLKADPQADSVVSVIRVPHQFTPSSLLRIEDGYLVPALGGREEGPLRRQDKEAVYARNGAAVYVIRRETLLEQRSLFGQRCLPYEMNAASSVDIDGPDDLRYAEFLLSRGRKQGTC
jgi:CMP-N-acetylneuraminic acid synthetase